MTAAGSHAGRTAVVTGAAGGIGQAIAVGLAARGATVVATDVADLGETADRLGSAGDGSRVATVDVTDAASVEHLREEVQARLSRCDILVNNAAILETKSWDELEYELWQRVLRVNLDGPMLMCKALVPLMRTGGWGRIVNVSSGSIQQPIPVSVAYRTSKMGLIGFTRAMSAALGGDGITVNAICPSITHTPMVDDMAEDVIADGISRQAIKRLAEPADIAGGVFVLTSDDAHWITGQTVLVNAGGTFL